MALPLDYRAIRVWHVRGDLPGNWRELQKRAWREGVRSMRCTLTTPEGGSVPAIWRPITGFMRRWPATAITAGGDSGGQRRRNKQSRTAR